MVSLGPRGSLGAVTGVGRVLRILRAARVRLPDDPYGLGDDPRRAAALVLRCQGTAVLLRLARRPRRTLTVWTESGMERFEGVIDFSDDGEGLSVRREGGTSALLIPRRILIRFAVSSSESLEVVSVEVPDRSCLP